MHRRHSRAIPILSTLLAASILLSGCNRRTPENQADAAPEVEVAVMTPTTVKLDTELPGRTSAYTIAEIRPQVGGIIKTRAFTEGSDVKTGALLYQIDARTYQANLDSARAALAKARANLFSVGLQAGRYSDLVQIKAVSQQDYDNAVAALQQAEADVASSQAAVDSARINLDYTRVTAPISGRIGQSTVTAGALVTASQTNSLATVQQLDPIYVDVTQSSSQLLKLQRDLAAGAIEKSAAGKAKVQLVLEDGSTYPLAGTLQFAGVTVDQTTGSVTLRAVFPNPQHTLLPGMYVRTIVQQGVKNDAILVPQQGVTRDSRGDTSSLVLNADNKVEQRALKVDRTIGAQWLVSEGLKAGDRVIVAGLQKVRPGVEAKVAAAAGSAAPATSAKPQ